MAERRHVFTIPPHRSFADALAAGLMSNDGAALARTTVLLPNRRAVRALTEAFVRASGGALLLPRMLPVGDVGEDEALGLLDDMLELESELPPAAENFERRMLLMPLVGRWQKRVGRPGAAVETLRLADALARTLDQLQLEGIDPDELEQAGGELGLHWEKTAAFLRIVIREWPKILGAAGKIDRVERAGKRCFGALPPAGAPLRPSAGSSRPGWRAPIRRSPNCSRRSRGLPPARSSYPASIPRRATGTRSHAFPAIRRPRCGSCSIAWASPEARSRRGARRRNRDGPEARGADIARALALPESTAHWPAANGFAGLKVIEAASPAEEATVIALAMRRQLETPGATAALVTPDRNLARRVAAQLGRWEIEVDDSAGTPLGRTPAGTLLTAAVEAGARGFAPGALLALLKHPLAGPEETAERLIWLDDVRRLDLALRGMRPAPGLAGIAARVRAGADLKLKAWWKAIRPRLSPLEALMKPPRRLDESADALRAFAEVLSGERLWRGPAGRAAADLIADLIAHGGSAGKIPPADLPALLAAMMHDVAVRPAFGKHPRLAIYGLLEARLQCADLMILGGLSEGVWPAAASFDPWLPPALCRRLGLPESERSIGLAAHDFVSAAGAREVLLTRARRDASAPTVPSRFWLRLTAFAGGKLEADEALLASARALDERPKVAAAPPPRPCPPLTARPRKISVTQVDRLRADPFSFYAEKILRLRRLDPIDAELSAAERGTLVHAMLERLIIGQSLHDADAREAAVRETLRQYADQPLIGALWRPRVARMLDWVAALLSERLGEGWSMPVSEVSGELDAFGVTLRGTADIVQLGTGLLIADFKTGAVPSQTRVEAGYAVQLGLLAWLAGAGALSGIKAAEVGEIAYWKLSGGEPAGKETSSRSKYKKAWTDLPAFIELSRSALQEVVEHYLTGARPFEAKVKPEYALHMHDYDHLARLAEWRGRR